MVKMNNLMQKTIRAFDKVAVAEHLASAAIMAAVTCSSNLQQ